MTDVVMPQMGESIVEGTLTKWVKKVGEKVNADEPLFEISTDKVDTEIPAPASGVLTEMLVQEGQTVQVTAVVARINDGSAAGPPAPAAKAEAPKAEAPKMEPDPVAQPVAVKSEPAPAAPPQAAPAPTAASAPAGPLSPLVRRMARENNLDLTKVRGTGAGGRITKEDVEGFMKGGAVAPAPAAAPAAVPAPKFSFDGAKTRTEPMSTMRQKIAEHMVMSKRVSAHVTTVHRVDMTKIAKMRAKHKDAFAARHGMSLTFLPFVTRAAAQAVAEFPILNASIDGTNIVYHQEINIGIAVALDGGLIVPVIKSADEKNVTGLQK